MRNKRKNVFSKWMAFCLTLIMTITMALPVQAKVDAVAKYSLTVTGKESDAGATVDVYRLIKINFDTNAQQAQEPFYEWEDSVAKWLRSNNHSEYVGTEGDNQVTEAYIELGAADLSSLMKELQTVIKNNTLSGLTPKQGTITADDNYQTTFNDMDMGIYLILTTADANGEHNGHDYAPATANIVPVYSDGNWNVENAEVVIKGSPSSIEKEVNDHTVAIGDVLEYTITAPVPTYPEDAIAKMFRIGDKLPKGITFEKSYANNKLTVTAVYTDGTTKQIGTSEGTNNYFKYYFEAEDCGGVIQPNWSSESNGVEASFILAFTYDELIKDFGTSESNSALKEIKVTYQATVNEHAFEDDALENSAYVGQNDPYDANDYDTTTDDKEKVFTYGIAISKVDKSDNNKPLSGAQFELLEDDKITKITFVKTADGTYRLAKTDETEETTTTLEVNANGKLNLNGLATGTYYLKETKAPKGYQVLKDLREIKIIDKEADAEDYDHSKNPNLDAGIIDDAGDFTGNKTNIYYATVENSKPPIMPVTGGMGTILFTIVGVVLVAGGLTLIVTYTRRKHS